MKKSYTDLNFLFEKNNEDIIFNIYSKELDNDDLKLLSEQSSLNLDYLLKYKKTPLILVINYLLSFLENNDNKPKSKLKTTVGDIIAVILLTIADPTFLIRQNSIINDNKEVFSKVKKYFGFDELGDTYIDTTEIKHLLSNNEIQLFLSKMEKHKFLTKNNNRYYINDDYILKFVKVH